MSTFLVKVNNQYLEAKYLNKILNQNGETYYQVMTPLGHTYVTVEEIYLPIKEGNNATN